MSEFISDFGELCVIAAAAMPVVGAMMIMLMEVVG